MARAGGDATARARERELLGYQIAELDAAGLQGGDEDERLALEEDRLGQAASHRAAAHTAHEGLTGEEQVLDRLGQVVSATAGHPPLAALHKRLRGLAAEMADAAAEARETADSLQEDPERLEEVVARRSVLKELRRKYAGPAGDLLDVLAFHRQACGRLAELESLEGLAQRLGQDHEQAPGGAAPGLGGTGRGPAPGGGFVCRAVENELHRLAMPRARFEVRVGGEPGPEGAGPPDGASSGEGDEAGGDADLRALAGEDVTFLLAANPGEPVLPLAKVASGGELARAMLALRLVLLAAGTKASGAMAGGRRAGGEIGGEIAGGEIAGGEIAGGEMAGGEIAGGEIAGGEMAGGEMPVEMAGPAPWFSTRSTPASAARRRSRGPGAGRAGAAVPGDRRHPSGPGGRFCRRPGGGEQARA